MVNDMNSQCFNCKFLQMLPGEAFCVAFPDGIPARVKWNQIVHDRVMQGQIGKTVWESNGENEDYVPTLVGIDGGERVV